MLPIRGYPFGPGGYGGRPLFCRHFKSKTKDAAAQSEAAYSILLLSISSGKPAREPASGGVTNFVGQTQLYMWPVGDNVKESPVTGHAPCLMNAVPIHTA
jgi:hypothetical protein